MNNNSERKVVPEATPVTAPFWDGLKEGALRLQQCNECKHVIHYPRGHCPMCASSNVGWFTASGRGTLHSYVINYLPAPGWEAEVPYVIAIVKLEEGPTLMSNLVAVDPEPTALELDMPLRLVIGTRGDMAIPLFSPLGQGDAGA